MRVRLPLVELPSRAIPSGEYKLEAVSDSGSQSAVFVVKKEEKREADTTLVSFNANLGAARRLAFIGHQWLLRGKFDEALRSLQASLDSAPTREASIEMARVDASAGRYDEARERLQRILAAQADDFEALSVLAYVEASLQLRSGCPTVPACFGGTGFTGHPIGSRKIAATVIFHIA